jgi:hypothetical protein
MEHVNSEANHTLDDLGIAKNAREEKIRARAVTTADKLKADAENAQMAKLYREHVLGEKPVEGWFRSTPSGPPQTTPRRPSTGGRKPSRSLEIDLAKLNLGFQTTKAVPDGNGLCCLHRAEF